MTIALLRILGGGLGLLNSFKRFIPIAFAGVIIIISIAVSFFHSIQQGDFTIFLDEIVNDIFAADYKIYTNVMLAVEDDDRYGLISLSQIFSGLIVIYYLSKWIGWALIRFTGSQAFGMAYIFGFFIIGIIELSAVKAVNGIWFFPFKGIFTLVINFPAVLKNINFNIIENLLNMVREKPENIEVIETTIKEVVVNNSIDKIHNSHII